MRVDAQFKLSKLPVQRKPAFVKGALSMKGIALEQSALDVVSRFSAGKYQDFLSLCDKISAKRAGHVKIIFASPAEMFNIDFTALNNEQITPNNGIVDFRLICDSMGEKAGSRPVAGDLKVEDDPRMLWEALIRFCYGVEGRKFRDKLTGKKRSLEVMDLRRPYTLPEAILRPFASSLGGVASQAWEGNVRRPVPGYSEEYVLKHFARVHRQMLVRDPKSGEIVGFSTVNQLEDRERDIRALLFEAGMVIPRYQNMRISTSLASQMFFDALVANQLSPFTIPGRTANPQAIGGMHVLSNFFPNAFNPEGRPNDRQKRLFHLVADFLCPQQNRHEETFVIDDVYPLESGLVIPPHIIPSYTRDKRIDELCWRLLEYGKYNSPEFYDGELSSINLQPVIAGLQEISQGKIGPISDEGSFRQLIFRSDLFALLQPGIEGDRLHPYTHQLAEFTAKARSGDFAAQDRDTQEHIKYFNRLLLEDLFPDLPKRKAKAMIIMGEMNTGVRKEINTKQQRINLQNWALAFLRNLAMR